MRLLQLPMAFESGFFDWYLVDCPICIGSKCCKFLGLFPIIFICQRILFSLIKCIPLRGNLTNQKMFLPKCCSPIDIRCKCFYGEYDTCNLYTTSDQCPLKYFAKLLTFWYIAQYLKGCTLSTITKGVESGPQVPSGDSLDTKKKMETFIKF